MKEKNQLAKHSWFGISLGMAVTFGAMTASAEFALVGDSNSELSYDGTNAVVKYTQSGSLKVTGSGTVEILLVGGGGGAGSGYPEWLTGDGRGGAGGGAGGVVYRQTYQVDPGTYQISVGAGGTGGGWTYDLATVAPNGTNGGDSSAFGLVAYGGGGGAGAGNQMGHRPGLAGGSGGGSCNNWAEDRVDGGKAVPGQGYDGGYSELIYFPAGGGGAGEAGGVGNEHGGKGGDGLMFDITGEEVWYAGGGAGLRGESHISSVQGGKGGGGAGTAGTDGLGGGGSGGCNGGSGVVIIRYVPNAEGLNGDIAGGDETLMADGKVCVFKADDQISISGTCIVDVLLVGGGGGAGSCYPESVKDDGRGGAGGGAGGVVYKSLALEAGTYDVIVGAGGMGGGWTLDGATVAPNGTNGGDSSAFGLVAYGGGGGAGAGNQMGHRPGLAGGSGGGSCNNFAEDRVDGGKAAPGQGYDGGYSELIYFPAGGGGAGEAGGVGNEHGGKGGDGLMFDITGEEVWYAGGGAGLRGESHISSVQGGKGGGGAGTAGTDGLGGGGSGGCNGGSGVVIVRLRRPYDNVCEVLRQKATGGVRRKIDSQTIYHTFTESGSFVMPENGIVEILLVGGGGGAGAGYPEWLAGDGRGGAGGGAGGVVYRKKMTLLSGTYPVNVGAGGTGGGWTSDMATVAPNGTNGGDSSAFGLVAYGGGGGAGAGSQMGHRPGLAGGSGGGSCNNWAEGRVDGGKAVPGQGYDGGYSELIYFPAGGGGAGEAGGVGNEHGGKGGDGLMFDITGEEVWYAGGGAGLRGESHISSVQGGKGGGGTGTAGTDGLGGGGSGGCNGGSGVVIIRYKYRSQGLVIIAQ